MDSSVYLKGHHCTLPEELRLDLRLTALKKASNWTKLKLWLHRIITVSAMNPNTKMIFRSEFCYKTEQKRHLHKYYHVIHPLSIVRIYWEMIMLFISAGIVIIYSIDMGFEEFSPEYQNSLYYLTFFDICCILDVILTFQTGYIETHTRDVVLEPSRIAKRYLKTYLFFSLLASIPHKLIFEHLMDDAAYSYDLLILFKMYHVKTFMVYTRSFCFLLGIGPESYMLMKYIIFMSLAMHWMACLFMVVPMVAIDVRGKILPLSWIVKAELVDIHKVHLKSFKEQYKTCLYQATCTMFCNSYGKVFPDVVEDYILQIFTYIFGHVVMGFIFVLFLNKAMTFTNKTIKRMEILSEVDEYMRHRHFTRPIQKRLKMFYKFRTFRSHGKQETVNSTLTERLKLEVQLYCNMKIVDNVPIFRELPEHLLKMVIPFMTEEVFLPTDILARAGTEGECMFFIISGTLALLSQSGKEYAHLQDGEFFGEIELILKDQRRFCTVIAIEISEVLILDRRHFIRCFMSDIHAYMKIIEASIERMITVTETEFIKKKMILTLQNLENENKLTKRPSQILAEEMTDEFTPTPSTLGPPAVVEFREAMPPSSESP